MDEQNIPIDINTSKLLEWLISRRHVNKDWQNSVLNIREKINNAIQDMPAHEGIIKLLSGQHINYFHCLKIIEILKETEADTKNMFGRYGSQRMKDWQDIVSSYQKDNVYLAEAAQIIIRNVNYEIPSLKKQIAKLEQTQAESEKKIKDYKKSEATAMKEFTTACEQLGIEGKDLKKELLGLLKELPAIYKTTSEKIKIVKPAIELYVEFCKYLSGKEHIGEFEVLGALRYLVENGNTTTYEYTYGEKPLKIEEEKESIETEKDEAEIDFGDDNAIDFGNVDIDFGDSTPEIVAEDANIDWGGLKREDSFEIVDYSDVDVNLEESGIIVEKSGTDGGVARGEEALTILDNPKTREQIINNLMELNAFLKLRLFELSTESNSFAISQMQDAPVILQMQTIESVTALSDCVHLALDQLTNKRIQHLHNIKHSPKYVDILTANLKQKLSLAERMKTNVKLLEKKIQELSGEIKKIHPTIKVLMEASKQLQKEVESDISKKYKGRVVNLIGGVNSL